MVCVLLSSLKLWAWITQPYFTKQRVTMVTQIMETDQVNLSLSLSLPILHFFSFSHFLSLLAVSQLLSKWNINDSSGCIFTSHDLKYKK